ncbi:hypothetical protein B0H14DRAFT_2649922 [Mycena olivaceomarginata]|nr:hypothetical protein B0H14DRAFT_2649922 [Mycena olivaceomarginata]
MSKQKRNPSEPMMHAIYCYRWRQKYVRFHELCLHYNGTYAIEIWRTTDAKTEKEWLATEPLITPLLLKFFNPGWKNDVPLPPDIAKIVHFLSPTTAVNPFWVILPANDGKHSVILYRPEILTKLYKQLNIRKLSTEHHITTMFGGLNFALLLGLDENFRLKQLPVILSYDVGCKYVAKVCHYYGKGNPQMDGESVERPWALMDTALHTLYRSKL